MSPSAIPNGIDANSPSAIPNGTNCATANAEFTYPEPQRPYHVLKQYHSKPTKLRVAGVGAGASGMYTQNLKHLSMPLTAACTGICLAYKMEKMLEAGSWELTLFEKNPHYGGTWYENT
jgi:hypothetical protein